jgi:hypothetical protein
MDDLETRLHDAGADVRARATDVADSDAVLRRLRASSAGGLPSPAVRRIVAGIAAAAVLLVGFIILRPHDSDRTITGASDSVDPVTTTSELSVAASTAPPNVAVNEPTTVATTAATTATTAVTPSSSPLTTDAPFGASCTYTDPGRFPISVARALTCPDGTTVDVQGTLILDQEGVAWLCAQIAESETPPCVGEGLQVIGAPNPGDISPPRPYYTGRKQGNSLILGPVPIVDVPSETPAGPVVTEVPMSEIPAAIVSGVVEIEGTCVRLGTGISSQIVVWPSGTQWDANRREIVLPDGQHISNGAFINGGGGNYSVANIPGLDPIAIAALTACLPPGSDTSSPDAVVLAFPETVTNPTPVMPTG